jgi:hypothetical protein
MSEYILNIGLVGLLLLGAVGASPLQARSSVNVTNPAHNKTLTEELELNVLQIIAPSLTISKLRIASLFSKIKSPLTPISNPHGSNGSISITIAVISIEQGFIITSPIEKSAD